MPTHRAEVARYKAALLQGSRNVYRRLSVEENLRFFAGLQGISPHEAKKRAEELIHFFGLWEKRKVTGNLLSHGMKQKLAWACAQVIIFSRGRITANELGLNILGLFPARAYR